MLSEVEQHERSGVLVLRVWIETAAAEPLRASITAERDLQAHNRMAVAAAGVPQIVEVVRAWVEDFAQTAAP
jgi:hypothetical protein